MSPPPVAEAFNELKDALLPSERVSKVVRMSSSHSSVAKKLSQIFKGQLLPQKLPNAYRAADPSIVFVLPSTGEGVDIGLRHASARGGVLQTPREPW